MAGTTAPNSLLQRPYPDWVLSGENFKSNQIPDETAESWFRSSGTGLNVLELQQASATERPSEATKRKAATDAQLEIPAPEPASTQLVIAVLGLLLCGWKLERRRHRRFEKQAEG